MYIIDIRHDENYFKLFNPSTHPYIHNVPKCLLYYNEEKVTRR